MEHQQAALPVTSTLRESSTASKTPINSLEWLIVVVGVRGRKILIIFLRIGVKTTIWKAEKLLLFYDNVLSV